MRATSVIVIGLIACGISAINIASAATSLPYIRDKTDPFDQYSYDAVDTMRKNIRSQGVLQYDANDNLIVDSNNIPIGMPTQHPKVFLTANRIPQIVQNINSNAELQGLTQQIVNHAESKIGVTITDAGGHSDEPDGQPAVLSNAFLCQAGTSFNGVTTGHNQDFYCQEGVRHLLDLASIDTTYVHNEYTGLPLGYDWLFEYMTDQQRQVVATKLLQYGEINNGQVVSFNDPPGAQLLGPLALSGDVDIADQAEVTRLLNLFQNGLVFGDTADLDISSGKVPEGGRTVMFQQMIVPQGIGTEGWGYSRWNHPTHPVLLAWAQVLGEDYYQLDFYQNWPLHYLSLFGNQRQHGDKYAFEKKAPWTGADINLMMELGLSSTNQSAASLSKYDRDTDRATLSNKVLFVALSDPGLEKAGPGQQNLPTTQFFAGANNLTARNNWDASTPDTAWAWFQSSVWTAVRDQGPLNDINIFKHGGMLLPKLEQNHDYDGLNRTNTIVLYEPNEFANQTFIPDNSYDNAALYSFGRGADGRRYRGDLGDSLQTLDKDFESYHKGMRFVEENPDHYLYAFGEGDQVMLGVEGSDVDPLQSKIQSSRIKLDHWNRQFTWFRTTPLGKNAYNNNEIDHFIVIDRLTEPVTSSGNTTDVHLLWNLNKNPDIQDKDSEVAQSGVEHIPGQAGILRYSTGNRIVATNDVVTDWGTAHGKIAIDTLAPVSPTYFKIGGLETRNIDIYGNLHQKSLRIGDSEDDNGQKIRGLYKVQVTTPSTDREQTYIHVLQAMDVNQDPNPTFLLQGDTVIGAAVDKNISLFAQTEQQLQTGTITLPDNLPSRTDYRLLITDLIPEAEYSLMINGTTQTITSSETGTIFQADLALDPNNIISIQQTGPPTITIDSNKTTFTVSVGQLLEFTAQSTAAVDQIIQSFIAENLPTGAIFE